MKLSKLLILLVSVILMSFMLISTLPACSTQTDEDKITENVLRAVNAGDYNKYLNSFYEDVRPGVQSEHDWNAVVAEIKNLYGEYENNSLEFWKTEVEDSNTARYYKTKFTKNPEVIIRAVFQDVNGKSELVGFWLVQE